MKKTKNTDVKRRCKNKKAGTKRTGPSPLLPWEPDYNLHIRQVGRLSAGPLLPTSGVGQSRAGRPANCGGIWHPL